MGIKVKNKQKGVVLIVALVFLIALTAVASILMLNTTSDMKMAGASQERVIAMEEAIGSVDEVILKQFNGVNNFTKTTFVPAIGVAVTASDTNAVITIPNTNINSVAVNCPPSKDPSSIFKCNVLMIRVDKNYGYGNSSNIQVRAGIAQQLLDIGS
jgi:Tfp pilus assembly protein PilX